MKTLSSSGLFGIQYSCYRKKVLDVAWWPMFREHDKPSTATFLNFGRGMKL